MSRPPKPLNGAPQKPQRGVDGIDRNMRFIALADGCVPNAKYSSQSSGLNSSPGFFLAFLTSVLSIRRWKNVGGSPGSFQRRPAEPVSTTRTYWPSHVVL